MNLNKKVAFYTLGCKLNFSETSTIARMFEDRGYSKVDFKTEADVYLINTCSVTELADKKCRQAIKKAIKISPNAIIAVVGCYSQLKPEEIAKIEGVDLVVGTKDKYKIVDYVETHQRNNKTEIRSCEIEKVENFNSSFSLGDRTRSFLKVQDGCDYHCAYCTIPLARGKSRNTDIETIVKQANIIAKEGFKEVVITGVNIGDFGKSTGETFFELLQELEKVEGIERYRISSIEPNLLTTEIIEFVAQSKKIMPHFHIPLQAGSNKILALMRRRYKRELFGEKIQKIKTLMPNAFIGIDVIVGFPQETDEDFESAYKFLDDLKPAFLHVFSYSERANTPTCNMPNKVDSKTIKQRSIILHNLCNGLHRDFYKKFENISTKVLFEAQQHGEKMFGYTANYLKVEVDYDEKFINQIVETELGEINKQGNILGSIKM